jgi:hypothetical protein
LRRISCRFAGTFSFPGVFTHFYTYYRVLKNIAYWSADVVYYSFQKNFRFFRGLSMSSYDLDNYFPLQGTCFKCGRDLRHRVFDEINRKFSSGYSVENLAAVYKVPTRAIELVLQQNSVSPLGISFTPTNRVMSMAA